MGSLNFSFNLPDLSKYGNIGNKLKEKIDSVGITEKLKSKLDDTVGGLTDKLDISSITDKFDVNSLMDQVQMPELDMSALDTSQLDVNGQIQDMLNNMSVTDL